MNKITKKENNLIEDETLEISASKTIAIIISFTLFSFFVPYFAIALFY